MVNDRNLLHVRRVSPVWVVCLLLAFMGLPALIAAADVPTNRRAIVVVERNTENMQALAEARGLELGAPVYLRITKRPAELTAYLQSADGSYLPLRTWKICSFSGGLGPKQAEGDGKSPEGFYSVRPRQLNPSSSYHLSFNLGFPNAYDRAQGYTGSFLMVHGDCVSIGCYAMTDEGIEEIWTVMQAAFDSGQTTIPVHIFPFAMPGGKLPEGWKSHEAAAFWTELAPAWAAFETSARVPEVNVSGGTYEIVSPVAPSGVQ